MAGRLAAMAVLAWVASGQQIRHYWVSDEKLKERFGAVETKNRLRQERLQRQFEEAGCAGERLALQPVRGTKIPNVICTLPGQTAVTVVVGAHHDKSVASQTGAVDNWSGASLLPSLYESLAKEPRQRTYVFVGFTAEEVGLVGSEEFLKQWRKAGRPDPEAMVNVDSVGMTPTKVWPGRSDERLVSVLARLAEAMKLPLGGVDVGAVGDSDSRSFALKKIPVVDIHSVTQQTLRVLHSPDDGPAAVRFEYYRDTYRLLAGFLALMDTLPPAAQAANGQ